MSSLRFRYQTLEFGDQDIHLRTLRDNQEFDDPEGIAEAMGISSAAWPLFGIIWASSEVLAHHMQDYDITGLRILEVGCGIGLASLMLNQRGADITATDHHPSVEEFLQQNVALNNGEVIPFVRTGWNDEPSQLGKFDLIIGSDILYEPEHAHELAEFIEQHAKPECEVIIIDPGRSQASRFSRYMTVNGYELEKQKPQHTDYLAVPYKGNILTYRRG